MGTINREAVAERLGLKLGDPQRSTLEGPVSAVESLVNTWCSTEWTPAQAEGAVMLAARLHRRRNSPGGVESFTELGPVYIQRKDPDVAMLLGLAEWIAPGVA